ncbi:hypothetical protein M752DRAFT_330520 [Aspergillus phoenicis ATCC 13157]|uniref:Uncharacterized protein n=1 Tax=Aspergillus phoenicis ATCC 13157 TaxID=1353007 RepID=A0A370P5S0_ASPPH|nr:hypothetical protein M752DRAFT_330520 [Aspergillus phoenicis ATCC 13157]
MEEDNNLAATLLLKTCIYLGVFSVHCKGKTSLHTASLSLSSTCLPRFVERAPPLRCVLTPTNLDWVPNTFRVPDICAPWDNTIGVCRLPTFLTACQLHDVEHNLVDSGFLRPSLFRLGDIGILELLCITPTQSYLLYFLPPICKHPIFPVQ